MPSTSAFWRPGSAPFAAVRERHLDRLGDLIEAGITETIRQKRVTYDLHRQMKGATKVKTSEFAAAIIDNMALAAAA